MSELEEAEQAPWPDEARAARASAAVHPFPSRAASAAPASGPKAAPMVSFDRAELREILNLYGRRVADGEWRDYAIAFSPQKAVFSIYRRASEVPLYRVEKDPSLARRQGAYAVVASTGLILKRGQDLARVLQVLDRKPKLVVV
jgi:hypothetical protein